MKQNLITRTANTARIMLDGKQIGLLQNVRANDDYGMEPAAGIGDIHVQEYVPSLARHQISVSKLALRKTSLYKQGIIPENGINVLKGNVFDIEIFDKATGEVVRKYLSCSYASGDIEVNRSAVIGTNCQFYALDVAGKM